MTRGNIPMTDYEQEFKELLRDISQGSEEAARKFLEEYGGYIIAVVRKRLHKKLRSKFDSQDFLQDVCASFFREPPPPEVFADTTALLKYLAKMARDKVFATSRKRLVRDRFNVNRENSLEGSACVEAQAKTGREPTPSRLALVQDQLARADEELSVPVRMTLRFLRLGYTHEEIAQYLGVHVRQVARYVAVLRERFRA
jgi:RNA polymerase sigma factor (sigma-70 family)